MAWLEPLSGSLNRSPVDRDPNVTNIAERAQGAPSSLATTPALRGAAVQESGSQKLLGEQLVRQLDMKRSLLIQVTVPLDLETRFLKLDKARDQISNQSVKVTWRFLHEQDSAGAESNAQSTSGEVQPQKMLHKSRIT